MVTRPIVSKRSGCYCLWKGPVSMSDARFLLRSFTAQSRPYYVFWEFYDIKLLDANQDSYLG